MSARLSLFDAAWSAARMPLALPVHEPVFRVPPCDLPMYGRYDESEFIEPFHARGCSYIFLMPPLTGWQFEVPAECRHWPSVKLDTTPLWVWEKCEIIDAVRANEENYESWFLFGDREGFRRAYRAARMIAAGRPAYDELYSGTPTYNDSPHPAAAKLFSIIAPAHERLASYELLDAHCSHLAERMFVGDSAFAQTACRVCGCTDEEDPRPEGCTWTEPDLCADCHGRELDGPGNGFSGDCDRCHRTSFSLQLIPLTHFAECPACQRGEPVNRRKGGR